MGSATRAARDASDGRYLVVGASCSPAGHGDVGILVGLDTLGRVLVYGGQLNHAENASRNLPITSKAQALYKFADLHVAAESPAFFGLPVRPPYRL